MVYERKMKAALLKGTRNLAVASMPNPSLDSNDVLIRVKAASICGSDVHMFKEGTEKEVVLGHDFSGVVEEVGGNVTEFKKGEKVTSEIVRYCGKCNYCYIGRYNLCTNAQYLGFEINGAFAEYVAAPAKNVVKIPETVSFEEAAILEPIALALHTFDFVSLSKKETVAIIGQGPIGLVMAQVAKLYGFNVIGIDIDEERVRLSESFGADFTVNAAKENLKEKILSITNGYGVSCTIEAAGPEDAVMSAYEITRLDGIVLLVGWSKFKLPRPPGEIVTVPVIDGPGKYKPAVELLSQGKVNVKKLITHHISLEELPHFIHLMADGKVKAVKVIVKP